jgi:hypothetical protein
VFSKTNELSKFRPFHVFIFIDWVYKMPNNTVGERIQTFSIISIVSTDSRSTTDSFNSCQHFSRPKSPNLRVVKLSTDFSQASYKTSCFLVFDVFLKLSVEKLVLKAVHLVLNFTKEQSTLT